MAVKNATTRKKIATVKLTEPELQLLVQVLGEFTYNQDLRADTDTFRLVYNKVYEAQRLFTRYT